MTIMSIYKPKSEQKEQAAKQNKEESLLVSTDDDDDDETLEEDDHLNSYLVKTERHTMFFRRRRSILSWFIAILVVFVILFVLIAVFWHRKPSSKSSKPYVASKVRMNYHVWKDNAAGVKRSFKVEGEFYQQVEIDVDSEMYEKLKVPPIMNAQRSTILHDFSQKLTAIVSLDRSHCFILPLNSTFVAPLREYYQLVRNIELGYHSANAELITDDYSILSTPISNVSQFGQHINRHCQYLDTYRLVRDSEPLELNKESTCRFRGEQYCLGNAGTNYMSTVRISRCLP